MLRNHTFIIVNTVANSFLRFFAIPKENDNMRQIVAISQDLDVEAKKQEKK